MLGKNHAYHVYSIIQVLTLFFQYILNTFMTCLNVLCNKLLTFLAKIFNVFYEFARYWYGINYLIHAANLFCLQYILRFSRYANTKKKRVYILITTRLILKRDADVTTKKQSRFYESDMVII